ncbi:ABC transporter permease [Aristaeella hokkaidonensis]|uniref:ABC transporter permease n=1 Tax=Aristaeella hokkaidonensis TaxID=3046382 RepID=A0AC61MWS5_9FIRM|nr:ABC transporter permease [Aristaeella hokkaidonensis]QUC67102.1 ABC transporter permease [Aristaeella hokkaidonensis]SNT93587.1 ABC-2 type transporter [Aristaeella hokkaidonensis]
MSETIVKKERTFRHRDRLSQVPIYLGKQFRFFINESDWKVIPMAAVIAMLVSVVIRNRIFANMEGCVIGSFALTCVALWNGCFNSIQAICRERAIIKREHRSGMHITSYMFSHMVYQFVLCLVQTIVSLYVMHATGVPFPEEGIFLKKMMIVEFGITMLLISYAADMMSLFISSIAHTTTAAMTVMPFVLIFQLVFSGGVIPLPERIQPLSNFTISNYGIKAIASQCGYNELPMAAGWTAVNSMRNSEINEVITVGQVLDILNSDALAKHREDVVISPKTEAEMLEILDLGITGNAEKMIIKDPITFGELLDFANNSELIQKRRDKSFPVDITVGDLMEIFGEDNVKNFLQQRTAEAAQKKQYEKTRVNVLINWFFLCVFILGFALMSTVSLELIDKDKR